MSKSLIAVTVILPLVLVLALAPILANQALAFNHMGNPILPPHHQWRIFNDIDQITCKEDYALLVKANGTPACVSPSSYLRLADRGWGTFDSNIMKNRPMMMQNVMGQMMQDPNLSQQMIDNMMNNPQMMQSMMGNNQMMGMMRGGPMMGQGQMGGPMMGQGMMGKGMMMQNPQMMNSMMNQMMNDPELRQQMFDAMMNHKEMMQMMMHNQQFMNQLNP